jgi:hypothetical protein
MRLLSIGIGHPFDTEIERAHHPEGRKHRQAADAPAGPIVENACRCVFVESFSPVDNTSASRRTMEGQLAGGEPVH